MPTVLTCHKAFVFALGLKTLLALFLPAPVALAQYHIDSWTADNGLPQNSVLAIHQTRDGYLWLATSDGLVRFDGVRFTVFDKSNSPGITSNRFNALYEDRDGNLWIGTENGGVTRYTRGVFTTYTTEHGLPHNFIRGITGDENGQVWVLSNEQIMRWDEGRFRPADLNGLKSGFHGSAWDNQVFWSIDETRLHRFTRGRLTTLMVPGDTLSRSTRRFAEDPSGALWLETLDGELSRFKDGKVVKHDQVHKRHKRIKGHQGENTIRPEEKVARKGRQGRFWEISLGDELGRSLTFPSSSRPEKIPFHTLFEDHEGNLWLGTHGQGLYRLRKQVVSTYSKQHGLVDRNVYPIYEDRKGNIWIGAWRMGVSRLHEGKFASYTPRHGLASGFVTALHEDRAGRLWVSAHHGSNGGLRVFQGGRFTAPSDQILPDGTTAAVIHEDLEGALWFGTERGLVRYKQGASTIYTAREGLAGEDIKVVIDSAAGGLWIGAYGGLSRFKNGQFTGWTERDGVPSNSIRALYEDRDGVLWVGTYDGGLGRFEGGKFTRYTTREGLFNNGVFQILEDARGNLWMSCNRGIYRVSKEELNEVAEGRRSTFTSVAYGKSDGMLTAECNGGSWPAGVRARDGKLWFPTQDGVAVIDPEAVSTNQRPPPVMIEKFLLDREPVAVDRPVRITPGRENTEIQYTALSFLNSEHLRFKYRLEGLDHNWVDAGTRRTAYYSHVPPGAYLFKVIAANSDGVWNTEGRSLRVIVLPPFYRTWWFLALAALGGGGLILFGYKYRVARLEQAAAAREAFSRQLITSQEGERRRIAAELHDGLGQSLVIIRNWALLGAGQLAPQAPAKEELDGITAIASRAINEVREIAYDLGPYHLDRLGLAETIRDMVSRVARASKISFTTELDPLDGVLSRDAEMHLYRIAQEALNNLVKHSGATEATVSIKRLAGGVRLTVADNGKGFDAQAALSPAGKAGFGLNGMAERVRLLKGTYAIDSTPGRGTVVEVTLGAGGDNHGR